MNAAGNSCGSRFVTGLAVVLDVPPPEGSTVKMIVSDS
jgi:hypothetical protein